jgi:hypothetical protein
MIMQWKRQGSDYATEWQGIHFTLFEHPTTGRWNLLADGRHVRQTWSKARVAMEQIDDRQQFLIRQAAQAPGFISQVKQLKEQVACTPKLRLLADTGVVAKHG